MPKTNQPIKAIESDLITILEFIRVAEEQFPVETDKILSLMDLSDEAFSDAYIAIGEAIGFDFEDEGEDEDDDE